MNILALDLGTTTGYCLGQTGIGAPVPQAGSILWATKTEVTQFGRMRLTRTSDPRVLRFERWLAGKLQTTKLDAIIFEDVEFSTYTKQTQLWSSFRAVVWIAANAADVTVECVPVTTLKKFATGAGNADKSMMARALKMRHPEFSKKELDDNAVDAIFIWKWAAQTLARR